jgi:hypothetical protein
MKWYKNLAVRSFAEDGRGQKRSTAKVCTFLFAARKNRTLLSNKITQIKKE